MLFESPIGRVTQMATIGPRLVLVKTGNVSKDELYSLFERHLSEIAAALERHTLVEIDRTAITPLV